MAAAIGPMSAAAGMVGIPFGKHEKFISRIKQVVARIELEIPKKEGKFTCPITKYTMQNPFVLNCGHTFEETAIKEWMTLFKTCAFCRTPTITCALNKDLKDAIEEWQKEPPIPTFSLFQTENKIIASEYLRLARSCIDEKKYIEALEFYKKALLHTNSVEDYIDIPLLYEKLEDSGKSLLAYFYLALYQLEKLKAAESIFTLEHCKKISIKALEIDPLLVELDLSFAVSKEKLDRAMELALTQSSLDNAAYIYKMIIEHDPYQFAAYLALIPLFNDMDEKREFLSKAASYATERGDTDLATRFLKESEIPVFLKTMNMERWSNPLSITNLPPYPAKLLEFLDKPCPIWGADGTKASATHFIVPLFTYIEVVDKGSIHRVPRSLKALDALDKSAKGIGSKFISPQILKFEEKASVEGICRWVAMTKTILPGSVDINYTSQKSLAESMGYEIPSFSDAATCMLWKSRQGEKSLATVYTCCREVINNAQVVVADFASGGLSVFCCIYPSNSFGILGLREFS